MEWFTTFSYLFSLHGESLTSQLIIKDKQINYDNHHDESKTRTHRYNKLTGDGDLWVQNKITENLKLHFNLNILVAYIISALTSIWTREISQQNKLRQIMHVTHINTSKNLSIIRLYMQEHRELEVYQARKKATQVIMAL